MRNFTAAALVGLTGLGFSVVAQAETPASQNRYLGTMGTYLDTSSVREAETENPGAHLYFGLPLDDYPNWSLELGAAWNELQRDDDSGHDTIYQLGFDLLRHFEWKDSISPYLVTGLSASYEEIRDEESVLPTLAVGGGLLVSTGLSNLQLRIDARAVTQENDYTDGSGDSSGRTLLVDGRYGLGLQWLFAEAQVQDECAIRDCRADGDNDGVADVEDLCPDSLPGATVDRTGCEPVAVRDSDNDGVMDGQDQCPGTPPGEVVDSSGCTAAAEVVLDNVNFEFNSAQLTAEAKETLEPIAELLNGGLSSIRIEIAGHTDSVGDDDYNQALSARRAYAVKDFLAERGVAPGRMVATGYGARQPVADNATEEGRAENRRVVFRVMD